MLNITMRPCQLGSSINTRVERHGDEDVPACDIPLDGIMLTEAELNLLLDDPHASRCLFTAVAGVHQPALPMIAALSLRSKLEGATVTLSLHGCDKRAEVTDEEAIPTKYKRATVTLPAHLATATLPAPPSTTTAFRSS